MRLESGNLHDGAVPEVGQETVACCFRSDTVRIDRIASNWHVGARESWYDQPDTEWVVLVEGTATIEFDTGGDDRHSRDLKRGDWLLIPAHMKHRIARTSSDALWVAVHIADSSHTFTP